MVKLTIQLLEGVILMKVINHKVEKDSKFHYFEVQHCRLKPGDSFNYQGRMYRAEALNEKKNPENDEIVKILVATRLEF